MEYYKFKYNKIARSRTEQIIVKRGSKNIVLTVVNFNIMKIMKNRAQIFSLILMLVALHSVAVGLGLILLPNEAMNFFGFTNLTDRFFRTQGGVFHIVMATAYFIASRNVRQCSCLITFIITVKFMATLFLFSYYLFVSPIITVLLSGIGDLAMAVIVLVLYISTKNDLKNNGIDIS